MRSPEAGLAGVVEAANLIGSTQVQGRASLAGNLCNASPAADSVPALIAARATCVVAGPKGRREVAVESIAIGPGRTSLSPDEFILEFRLPKPQPRSADAYLRFIPRTEMDIAVVGVAVSLALDADGVCADALVVLGAVAPTAILVPLAVCCASRRPLDLRPHRDALRRLGAHPTVAAAKRAVERDRAPRRASTNLTLVWQARAQPPADRLRASARQGADRINALMAYSGMSREDMLNGLSQHLPNVVDKLTPEGRLPTEEEAVRLV
jgi:CO/xanthine dehydrogenase FAD-binding subunit